jgi:mono/diheme cytochrome c family protein
MRFVLGLALGILFVPFFAFFYFKLGMAPVAAADPVMPFEAWAAHTALHKRINSEMPPNVPLPASPENLIAGAKVYKENCAFCHGFKGQEQTAAAKGMFPKPPHLFQGHGVTDDPAGETYWKTRNGIRLSGMPGYKNSLSNDQIWQVSLMLANADKLPPEADPIVEGK